MRYFTLSFAVFLTACGGNQSPEPMEVAPAPTPVAMEEVVETSLEEIAPAPMKLDVAPNFLMGKTPAEVMKMVGTPTLVRRDNLVQHMLFETAACVLDVVYYADDAGAPYLAGYISARSKDSSAYDTKACLALQLPDGWLAEPALDETDNAPQTAAGLMPVEISEQ